MLKILKGGVIICSLFCALISYATSQLKEQYALGYYLSQQGKNTAAFTVMLALAQQNYAPAKHNVALSYRYGLGVEQNLEQAFFWFNAAHNDGIIDATVELANSYYDQGNMAEAEKLWLLAAEHHDEYALFNLAALYLEQGKLQQAQQYGQQAKYYKHPSAQQLLDTLSQEK